MTMAPQDMLVNILVCMTCIAWIAVGAGTSTDEYDSNSFHRVYWWIVICGTELFPALLKACCVVWTSKAWFLYATYPPPVCQVTSLSTAARGQNNMSTKWNDKHSTTYGKVFLLKAVLLNDNKDCLQCSTIIQLIMLDSPLILGFGSATSIRLW